MILPMVPAVEGAPLLPRPAFLWRAYRLDYDYERTQQTFVFEIKQRQLQRPASLWFSPIDKSKIPCPCQGKMLHFFHCKNINLQPLTREVNGFFTLADEEAPAG